MEKLLEIKINQLKSLKTQKHINLLNNFRDNANLQMHRHAYWSNHIMQMSSDLIITERFNLNILIKDTSTI